MLYRLVRPMKRPDTPIRYFRQRIPVDVQPKAKGLVLAIPVGDKTVTRRITDKAEVVKVSLGTRDTAEAKIRHANIAAYFEGVWRSLRQGPASLSHKQAVAIAGEVYKSFTEALEDNPGTPEIWQQVKLLHARVRTSASLEQWFGPLVDIELARKGLVVDDEGRERVLGQVAAAMDLSAERLERYALGDYSPDEYVERFPEWKPSQPAAPTPNASVSISGLLEGWWKEAQATGKTASTYDSYSRTVRLFTDFLKHDDATRVTPEDVVAFKDHRLSQINPRTGEPVSPKTVKDSDLAALKSIFGWAVGNRKLGSNPAKDITIRLGKRVRNRSTHFTTKEAAALLRAARAYSQSPNEHPSTATAKRWVPWLCAYTGARVGEMAQIRKEDVFKEDGHWVVRITPDAGPVKTKEARTIPLHAHLLEEGFLSFAQGSKSGHLFLSLEPGEEVKKKLRTLKNRLTTFARSVVTDTNVQPNHGWRHTFKTVGLEAGIEGRVLDALQGHAPRTEGETYGDVTVKAKARAIERFPRYKVED